MTKKAESNYERVYQIISGSQILVTFVQLKYSILVFKSNLFSFI